MSTPTTDPYQRALDLLDDGFWDRYMAQLEEDESQGRDEPQDQRASVPVPVQPTVAKNVSVLPLDRPSKSRTRRLRSSRSTVFQRSAIAAAAGIAIIAGVVVLSAEPEQESIEVFTPAGPTTTVEASPVAVATATAEIEATSVQPTATAEPQTTATPEPLPTPTPEPTVEASVQQPESPEPDSASSTGAESQGDGAPPPQRSTDRSRGSTGSRHA